MNISPWKGEFTAAFFAGVVVSCYLAIVCSVFALDISFWEKWQSLISGFGAVLAGTISVVAIYRQISVSEAHEQNRTRSKNLARRAAIAVPLSDLIEIQERVLDRLMPFLENAEHSSRFDEIYEFQRLPDNDFNRFVDLLEVAEDPASDDISTLLSDIQLQVSRLRSLALPVENSQSE